MRKGGGKQKGAQFERDCCRLLSLWVTNGKQEDCFWRSAMSGGRSTIARAKGKRLAAQAGDITCTSPEGAAFAKHFLAECKFYADLNLDGVFTGKGKLLEFWKVLKADCRKYDKTPFLIAKQNRTKVFIFVSTIGKNLLKLDRDFFTVRCTPENMYAVNADKFFAQCPPLK